MLAWHDIEYYLLPHAGELRLQVLRPATVSSLYRHLSEQGGRGGRPLAPSTVAHVHRTLRKALNDAVHVERLIPTNPAERAKRPRAARREVGGFWTTDQLRKLLQAARQQRLYAFYRLAAYTGARRGELLALRWDDVDLDAASTDSGEVFRPQVHRVWRLTGPARVRSLSKVTVQAREAAADIAEQLLARGWKGSSRLTGELPFTGLRRPHGHYTLGVSIQAFNDVVLATAKTTAPRRVCTTS